MNNPWRWRVVWKLLEKNQVCVESSVRWKEKALWCSFLPTLTPVITDALGRKVKGAEAGEKNKCFQEKRSLVETKFIASCCSAVILLITMNHGALMIWAKLGFSRAHPKPCPVEVSKRSLQWSTQKQWSWKVHLLHIGVEFAMSKALRLLTWRLYRFGIDVCSLYCTAGVILQYMYISPIKSNSMKLVLNIQTIHLYLLSLYIYYLAWLLSIYFLMYT